MLLVSNGTVITLGTGNQVIEDGAVLLEDNLIKAVGKRAELEAAYRPAAFLDARGGLIMPGLTNTHMHLYSTFARGMALKDLPPKTFGQILERLWWRLDKALNLEDIYYSALIPLLDCVKNGTTSILDHHASPHAVTGSLATIARAAKEVGMRSGLCYEVSDRDGLEIAREGIQENARFLEEVRKDDGGGLLSGTFGLHAAFTLGDATLKEAVEVAQSLAAGFHVHVAEGTEDVQTNLSRYGQRVVERLADRGVLGPKTLAVHCVHVNDQEIDLIRETGTMVIHNPESNMGNAVGYAPVLSMLRRGLLVGMGTDGYTTDMFEGIKVANILHKHAQGDPGAAWSEVPQMIFTNNSTIMGRFFSRPVGVLEPGAYADVIAVDYHPPTPLTRDNYYGHLLFGVSGGMVRHTIVNGRILMQDRELLAVDEEAVTRKARELAASLWERF
ncbi:MAG: putative aminohydrolase SsnA [Firmicutes bacterium]|nr:putative aminohydrolase SsnA [Bacillota bacterium]MCL5039069.1 putative aminohydrolase SsnA [Bacillota bacterium]